MGMRLFLAILFTLLIFTSNQVAVAFEQCNEPSCSDYVGVQKKSENKKDAAASVHCAMGCHHLTAMPQHDTFVSATADAPTTFWTEWLMPESVVGEGLIEPPSLA